MGDDYKYYRHVLHLFKDDDGIVKVYDGQRNDFFNLREYHFLSIVLFETDGFDYSPVFLRVDNLGFNLKLARRTPAKKTRRQ